MPKPAQNSQATLCAIALLAGTLLGMIMETIMAGRLRFLTGMFFGAYAGLLVTPFHLVFLARKPLKKAIPTIYAPACVVWALVLPFSNPMLSLAAVGGAIILMCVVVYFVVDDFHPAGACQKCGYNLTGNTSGVCPECGTPSEKARG